ncbi:caspase family protein [Streptomyces sp. NPDC097941]|uniref:caspase family protein n=1 Tax=Streptomyces sp. NPDC097941 TaxID=3155685 RepID=UPI003327CFFD
MTGREDEEGPRRFLIATAVSRYPNCAAWDRPGLVEARDRIIELFTGKLGYRHQTALGLDPTRRQLTDHLRAFCTSPERREDDLVVVYLSGHGEILEDDGEHVLLMADTDPADVSYTALPTADLVRVLRGTKIRRLLLILDTCYSGQGGNELAAAALERLSAQWGQGQSSSGPVIVSKTRPAVPGTRLGAAPRLPSALCSTQRSGPGNPAFGFVDGFRSSSEKVGARSKLFGPRCRPCGLGRAPTETSLAQRAREVSVGLIRIPVSAGTRAHEADADELPLLVHAAPVRVLDDSGPVGGGEARYLDGLPAVAVDQPDVSVR